MNVIRGAVVVVLNHKDEVLLLKRSDSASHHPGMWENPGGKLHAEESFEDAAVRELHEEAGISTGIEMIQKVYEKSMRDDEREDAFEVAIFTHKTSQVPVVSESTFSEWRWVSKSEISSVELAPYVVDDFRTLGYLE